MRLVCKSAKTIRDMIPFNYLKVKNESAQSLVETAIVLPILIFILIGVFEVGWLLRGYLILANADREAARFAVRPGYVDYEAEQPDYMPIVRQAFNSLSNQIPFSATGVIIISRIYVNTDYPCDPKLIFDATSPVYLKCNCHQAIVSPYTPTIAITPLEVPTYTYTYPETATQVTSLDYEALRGELIKENLIHNCNLMNTSSDARPQVDDAIYVEMWFKQYQLFGFPLISNPLTDPVSLYTSTAMRRIISR